MDILPQVFILLPILIFSVILHEVSHGLIAHRFGDDTALDSGRLTLNPIPHVDPLGSVIFPLACLIMQMPIFGWAKPVPVDPLRFSRYRTGVICVAVAGPCANILIAVALAGVLSLMISNFSALASYGFVIAALSQAILLNLVLAVFNLFPVPPLDGSRVLSALLPLELARQYERMEPYGFFIVMGLLALGVIGKILYPIVEFLYRFLLQLVGI